MVYFVSMVPLNLPPYDCVLKHEDGKVFILDVLRRKYLLLTPEEWVRQHFVHYVIDVHGYPRALMKVEGGLKFNTLSKRSDIVVFSREGTPWMLVECKAPDYKLRQQSIEQAAIYNHTLRARYIVVTNGMSQVCCEVDWTTATTRVMDALPAYG